MQQPSLSESVTRLDVGDEVDFQLGRHRRVAFGQQVHGPDRGASIRKRNDRSAMKCPGRLGRRPAPRHSHAHEILAHDKLLELEDASQPARVCFDRKLFLAHGGTVAEFKWAGKGEAYPGTALNWWELSRCNYSTRVQRAEPKWPVAGKFLRNCTALRGAGFRSAKTTTLHVVRLRGQHGYASKGEGHPSERLSLRGKLALRLSTARA